MFSQGGYETNPLVVSQRPAAFTAQMGLEAAGQLWLVHKLAPRHPRWAKGIALVQMGASTGAAINNIHQLR